VRRRRGHAPTVCLWLCSCGGGGTPSGWQRRRGRTCTGVTPARHRQTSAAAGRGGGAGDGDTIGGCGGCVGLPFCWLWSATDAGGAEVAAALSPFIDELFLWDGRWQDLGRAVGEPPLTAVCGGAVVMADGVCIQVCLQRSVGGENFPRLLPIEWTLPLFRWEVGEDTRRDIVAAFADADGRKRCAGRPRPWCMDCAGGGVFVATAARSRSGGRRPAFYPGVCTLSTPFILLASHYA